MRRSRAVLVIGWICFLVGMFLSISLLVVGGAFVFALFGSLAPFFSTGYVDDLPDWLLSILAVGVVGIALGVMLLGRRLIDSQAQEHIRRRT